MKLHFLRIITTIIGIFVLCISMRAMSQRSYHLECLNGQYFDFDVIDSTELVLALQTGEWAASDHLKEVWGVEIFTSNTGKIIQVLPPGKIAFILNSEDDLPFFNSKMVPYLTAENRFCPFLLLKKDEVRMILATNELKRIGISKSGGITEIYQMRDGRIFTVDDRHTFGSIYLLIEDYVSVERDLGGFSPGFAIPFIPNSESDQPEGDGN